MSVARIGKRANSKNSVAIVLSPTTHLIIMLCANDQRKKLITKIIVRFVEGNKQYGLKDIKSYDD